MSFAKLDEHGRKLEALEHALAILGADEATHMAVGGGEKRAEALGVLAGMHHARRPRRRSPTGSTAAEAEALNEEQQAAALREFRRHYTNLTCLPAEFVERQTRRAMRSEQLWRDLRPKNDWAGFLPALEGVIALVREEAALRADALGLDPYDALMEQYDPGNRAADIAPVFAELKAFLKDFVPEALAAQEERLAKTPLKPLSGNYPIDKQRELGLAMMAAVGFDLTHGSLSVSHHPFCGGVPTDVRITTRYRTSDFLSALMGVLHETGHALYEQNLPTGVVALAARQGARHGDAREPEPVRRKAARPQPGLLGLGAADGREASRRELERSTDILPHVHHVERGLIRVDADEVTYPLHVILRFELEQELVAGRLRAGRHSGGLGRQDARLSRPVDHRQFPPTGRCRTCTGRAAPSAISRPTRWAP